MQAAAARPVKRPRARAHRMLPGLRILFAITVLSVSVLIFALGAAAFLRSAHEDIANAPWRPIETPVTARVDLAPPTLAMLRVEPETATATPRADVPKPAAAAAALEMERRRLRRGGASPPRAEKPKRRQQQNRRKLPQRRQKPASPPPSPAVAAPAAEPARDAAPSPAIVETKGCGAEGRGGKSRRRQGQRHQGI